MSEQEGCLYWLKVQVLTTLIRLGLGLAILLVIGLCSAIRSNDPAPKRVAEPAAQTAPQGEPTR